MDIGKLFKVIIPNLYKKVSMPKPKNHFISEIKSKWYGSHYGGFFVCEDVLNKNSDLIIYSCGIGTDISFDKKILKKFPKSKVYGFDPTPISLQWIENQKKIKNFNFLPVGISNFNGNEKMFFPKYHGVSYGIYNWSNENSDEIIVEMRTINDLAAENNFKFIDVLKMDIEGSEFSVIKDLNFDDLEFGQILIEFHERFIENGNQLLNECLEILENKGYKCFAISDDYEYSFVNVKLIN